MRWLVDIDRLEAEGHVPAETAALMRSRAKADALALGINAVLGAGIVAVIAGVIALFEDAAATLALGLLLAAVGGAGLGRAEGSSRLLALAAAVTGLATAMGGAAYLLHEATGGTGGIVALGGAVAAAGLLLHGLGPEAMRSFAAWAAVIGAAAHLGGILASEGAPDLAPLAMGYAGIATLALGILVDLRLLSALAVVALASSVSATGYLHGSYFLAILEPALLVCLLLPLAGIAAAVGRRARERLARHARIAGLMAFIWINLALWIGSLWGDRVGASFAEPGPDAPPGAEPGFLVEIPADAFAALWALVVLVVGGWAAATGRRSVFNAAATFGAIHFYTQWFERLEAEPAAFIGAGLVAIAVAWGVYRTNQWLGARENGEAGGVAAAPGPKIGAPDARGAG